MRHKDPELMQRISDYIGDYFRQNHSTPTTREIASAMGISPASGYNYLVAMNKAGMLTYVRTTSIDGQKNLVIQRTGKGQRSASLS